AVLPAPGTGVEAEESPLVAPFRYDRDSEVPRSVTRPSPCSTGERVHGPHCWRNPGPCARHGGGGGRGRRQGQATDYAGTAVQSAAQDVQRRLPGVCQGLPRGEDAGGTAEGRPGKISLARQVRFEVPGAG